VQECTAQSSATLDAFLDIAYEGYSQRITSLELAKPVYELANEYLADRAMTFTSRYLHNYVTPSNAERLLEWATTHGFEDARASICRAAVRLGVTEAEGGVDTDNQSNIGVVPIEAIGLSMLESAQEGKGFPDVELIVEDGSVFAHRAVLRLVNGEMFEGGEEIYDASAFSRVR
jgi:hypothetical protein